MSIRTAVLAAAVASVFSFHNSLAVADVPTLSGDLVLRFSSSESNHQTFYLLEGISPTSLVLTLPSVIDFSVDPSKLGPGTLNWSNSTTWSTISLDQSNLFIGSTGGGSYSYTISPSLNAIQSFGPSQNAVTARVDFVMGPDTATNIPPTVFSNTVTANFNVTLPSGAHLNDDQFNVTLNNFTINSGASISNTNSMIIQNNYTNHGSGGLGGLVQGDFFNDALSANGDIANVDFLIIVGHMQNVGELQVANRLDLRSSSTNTGILRINGGTLHVDGPLANSGQLILSAGTLMGAETVTNTGAFQWTGGLIEVRRREQFLLFHHRQQ